MKNHLGTYECKLCLTLHNTEVLYMLYVKLMYIMYSKDCMFT